ncbi:MAG: SPOR domain-containing protein [Sphingomonas sp.]
MPTPSRPSDRGLAFALRRRSGEGRGDPRPRRARIRRHAQDAPESRARARARRPLAEAQAMAAIDVPPDQLDKRIMQWAAFARPTNAYDQVAALLGVRPIEDARPAGAARAGEPEPRSGGRRGRRPGRGRPRPIRSTNICRAFPKMPIRSSRRPLSIVAPAAEADTRVDSQPVAVAAATSRSCSARARRSSSPSPPPRRARRPLRAAARKPATTSSAPSALAAKGSYYVQIGAYSSVAVARDSWKRVVTRTPAVGRYQPHSARVTTKAGSFYRVSVGGFARADADGLCRAVKSSGGICFVRVQAGDQLASWAKGGNTQLASR